MKFLISCLFLIISSQSFALVDKTLLDKNDKLFSALLGSDQKEVTRLAGELYAQAKATGLKEAAELKNMTARHSKDENISFYAKFMEAFIPFAKKNGLDANHLIYYCPMVKKYWIQNNKLYPAVRNVFAQEMLECGEKAKT